MCDLIDQVFDPGMPTTVKKFSDLNESLTPMEIAYQFATRLASSGMSKSLKEMQFYQYILFMIDGDWGVRPPKGTNQNQQEPLAGAEIYIAADSGLVFKSANFFFSMS